MTESTSYSIVRITGSDSIVVTTPGTLGPIGPIGEPGITVSAIAPINPAPNQLWLDIS